MGNLGPRITCFPVSLSLVDQELLESRAGWGEEGPVVFFTCLVANTALVLS